MVILTQVSIFLSNELYFTRSETIWNDDLGISESHVYHQMGSNASLLFAGKNGTKGVTYHFSLHVFVFNKPIH